MSVKTAGVGHFQIPTAPAAGTSVTSGAANVYTTTYVQLIASTAAALYITGIYVEEAGATGATYISVQLATGAAAAETIIGQYLVAPTTGSTITRTYRSIFPPIPVATSTRISCKTADSVGAAAKLITLECIAQSNVVDDGITVGTVALVTTTTTVTNQLTAAAIATGVWQDATAGDFTTASSIGKALYVANIVPGAAGGHFIAGTNAATTITTGLTTTFTGNMTGSVASVTGAVGSVTGAVGSVTGAVGSVTGLTVANLDTTVSSRMASYTQPTGFLAATFPATVASTTNISAGTITTVTNLTNAATAGDFTATMKTSIGTAVAASAVASVTGNVGGNVSGSVGSVVGAVGSVTGAVGSVTGLTVANLDTTISSRLASAAYTAPDNAGITTAGIAAAAAAADTALIKPQTDKLTFTVANKIDANILVVNGITVTGAGTAGNPWGPV